ncbi:hypothetical protein ASZ78_003141 [Callipepla squamata]|uniref:PX domain-containing protein n=1 Tax=Callipepla squamata TaxID=9009 RepID=A0A226N835_CALSU|nr:hypothetical protein ASZ78_003141 [Callipepla squamata]
MVCRSLGANPDDLKDPIKISIPRYVLCGQGKDEHYEFEIKMTVLDETWTVFRRYSRFREMHRTLKLKYPEVSFAKNELTLRFKELNTKNLRLGEVLELKIIHVPKEYETQKLKLRST